MRNLLLAWFGAASLLCAQSTARPEGTYARLTLTEANKPVGDVVFQLLEKEAPITTANFIALAEGKKTWTDPKTGKKTKRKLYDGLTFFRIIPEVAMQGGDPLGDGTGFIETIADEFSNGLLFDRPGRVAMAHAGPGTAASQFFITDKAYPMWDREYTIFGQVVEGQEIVAKLTRAATDEERPNAPIRMSKVAIERSGAVKK